MTKIQALLISILITVSSYSQYSYIGEVSYQETVNYGSGNETTDYKLYFNTYFSFYEEVIVLNKGKDFGMDSEGNKKSSIYFNEDVPVYTFTDFKAKKIIFKKHIATEIYAVNDIFEKISWTIKEEFKKIGSYKCQKAICSFRGRDYTAWFTDKIPVQCGPWKLNNLKGLILEAYDKDGVYKVQATKIALSKTEKDITPKIHRLLKEKKISFLDYQVKWSKRHKDMITYLNSKLPKNSKPFKVESQELDKVKELEIFKK
jgi:GLPGLI family protein